MNEVRPIEELEAGDQFRKTIIGRADAFNGPAPLWHGWAIMDAFLAGIDYARSQLEEPQATPSSPPSENDA